MSTPLDPSLQLEGEEGRQRLERPRAEVDVDGVQAPGSIETA